MCNCDPYRKLGDNAERVGEVNADSGVPTIAGDGATPSIRSNPAYVSVKLNRTWLQLPADTPPDDYNACAYRCGGWLYKDWGIDAKIDHLWRECDDGMGDEIITPDETEYGLWDGDRFYTCARKIL